MTHIITYHKARSCGCQPGKGHYCTHQQGRDEFKTAWMKAITIGQASLEMSDDEMVRVGRNVLTVLIALAQRGFEETYGKESCNQNKKPGSNPAGD